MDDQTYSKLEEEYKTATFVRSREQIEEQLRTKDTIILFMGVGIAILFLSLIGLLFKSPETVTVTREVPVTREIPVVNEVVREVEVTRQSRAADGGPELYSCPNGQYFFPLHERTSGGRSARLMCATAEGIQHSLGNRYWDKKSLQITWYPPCATQDNLAEFDPIQKRVLRCLL
jgi:hypothetical protein